MAHDETQDTNLNTGRKAGSMAHKASGSISLPPRDSASPGPLSPPTGLGSTVKGTGSITSKVTGVLSTSYADPDFRDALALLDERAVSNRPEIRRQLRLDVQKDVIDSNGQIITEFGRVADQLRRIGVTMDRLNKSYQEMKSHVTSCHGATSSTLQEATKLMGQRRDIEMKQDLLKAVRDRFVLGEDETASLTMMSEPVNDAFFLALAKSKRIRKDCEVLLGFENQTLGSEIMDQTSKNMNMAFQKLYRWIQKEFRTMNLESPQINTHVRRALRVLAERPSLFQSCLEFFSEARDQILSDSFYLALTGTSATGTKDASIKPIEMVAHDPLRYVGDMLAWAHSAAVSEREALEALFVADGNDIARGIQEGRENELWKLMDEVDGSAEFDAVKALNELVDRDVSGASRILRQRVEQVISTNEETILAYKLANLLGFYRVTFSKLLGDQSVLLEAMSNLESEALRQFRSLMRDHIANLQTDSHQAPSNLEPPDFLHDCLSQLTAIMQTYDASLSVATDREAEFQPILAESFDPFISVCEDISTSVPSPSSSIFVVNCLRSAETTLQPFALFTNQRIERLRSSISAHSSQLVESQYRFFRTRSCLDPIFSALAPLREDDPSMMGKLRGLEVMKPEALTRTAQNLDDFLPSAVMDAMENIKQLQDSKLARDVTEEAAERFCADFEHVEELLVVADEEAVAEQRDKEDDSDSDSDGEEMPALSFRSVFPRTTGEIRVLLS